MVKQTREILGEILGLFLKVRKWCGQILCETIPTYLMYKLKNTISKDIHWKQSLRSSQNTWAGEYKVYDLVNCGPMNRYMVENLIVHNCGYGASVNRVRNILIMQGFPVTVGEAKIIHRDYWKLYAGIKRFESELQAVWQDTGGWIPSLAGKPICVPADYLHDIVNRFAQTSGHEVLMMLVHNIETLRRQRKIEMYPWIPDFHDETIFEVPEHNVPAVVQLFNDAMTMVNERLEMNVMMSGEPQIADNLAEIKCEDYHEWKRLQGGI